MNVLSWIAKQKMAWLALFVTWVATRQAVRWLQRPGHLDVIAAQAMDMSDVRPPKGAAPVELEAVRKAGAFLQIPAQALVTTAGETWVWAASGGAAARRYKALCGMTYSADDAARYQYRCPMDRSALIPQADASPLSRIARRVTVRVVSRHGNLVEALAADFNAGAQVVTRGQESLFPGDRLVETRWTADGVPDLPTAADVAQGARYRCPACGMTFSAAEAARHGFTDPMDGVALVPEGTP